MHDSAYQSVLEQLREMPTYLSKSLGGVPHSVLCRQSEGDKSPLVEHLWNVHDCDVELYGMRIRRVLAEDLPNLEPIDVGEWVDTRNYPGRSGDDAIRLFAERRAELIEQLTLLSSSALQRRGKRIDGSTISVMGIVEQLASHDRDHRCRIAAILKEFLLGKADA